MMTWVYALPAWLFMPGAVLVACALVSGALSVTRVRLIRNEKITHNDVAGPILGAMGTLLAVVIAFMVIGVWEHYNTAALTVDTEAGALSDIAHLAYALPQPMKKRIVNQALGYLRLAISDEFPRMRSGGESLAAREAVNRLQVTVASFVPQTRAQQALQAQELVYVGRLLDARRSRILANRAGIPTILWAVMFFSGFLTIGLSFYFRVDRPLAQYVMIIMLTAMISSIYALIAELDYPFRGDVGVTPISMQHVYDILREDARAR
jgi:hypothetical protein